MTQPIRLTPEDHVLIHACGALLASPFVCGDRPRDDEMIQRILRPVWRQASDDNLALQPFVHVAPDLVDASEHQLSVLRSTRGGVLRDYHRHRMAAAWDLIRERYPL